MKKYFVLKKVIPGLLFLVLILFNFNAEAQTPSWAAPTEANSLENPLKGNEKATQAGKKLYTQLCAICHGNKGKGDGVAGMALKPRPANFIKDIVQKQTDGAIYWKMTEGRAPMAAYKSSLTEEQRWQLVNYIRSLKK
jgi:mono/diheme cytochrome c family protein